MLKTQLLSLDLQKFAENDPQPTGSETKTYTQEQFDALQKELNSIKARNDELCKKEKEYKAKEKASLDEEQKKKLEQEEINNRLLELEKENKTMKIAKELALGGFEEKDITTLTEHMISGNVEQLCKALSTIHKNFKEQITKEVKAELQKTNKLPNGNTGGNEIDPDVQKVIDSNKKNANNKAREYYLK